MADTKISAMTLMGDGVLADADEFPVADATALTSDLAVTALQLRAYLGMGLRNANTADVAVAAATSVYLTGSSIAVPVGKLRIGTVFKWSLTFSKTAAGVATRQHFLRIGTAGTTADAAIITHTSPVPTAVTDQGILEIVAVIRGPLSASCILASSWFFAHATTGSTGLSSVNEVEVQQITSAAFDATTANLIVGLSCTTGASEVLTYQVVTATAEFL